MLQGITLNDLLDKSKFLLDQRETVLKAIRIIEPLFEPVYTPPALDYNCSLLEGLNLNVHGNRDGLAMSPAEGVLSLQDLEERAKRQLETEIKGEIEVKNIDFKDDPSDIVKEYVIIVLQYHIK